MYDFFAYNLLNEFIFFGYIYWMNLKCGFLLIIVTWRC